MEKLSDCIAKGEDWVLARMLHYVAASNFTHQACTLESCWRRSVANISQLMLELLQRGVTSLQWRGDEDLAGDPVVDFGVEEAARHQSRGVTITMFLGMLKYYRHSYFELVFQAGFEREYQHRCYHFLAGFFDRIELGIAAQWAKHDEDSLVKKLQQANLALAEDKIRYLKFPEMYDITKNLCGTGLILSDITAYRRNKLMLEARERFLEDVFDGIQDGINVIDTDFNIVRVNSIISEDWYSDRTPLAGRKCYEAYNNIDQPCDYCPAVKAMQQGELQQAVIFVEDFKGAPVWLEVYAFPLKSAAGEVTGVIEHMRDITQRKQAEEELRFLSLHDALTGMYNRSYFERKMTKIGRGDAMGVIVCDLDGLKFINDSLGHEVGDRLLLAVGQIMRRCFGDRHTVARIGGDEFAVLLQEVTASEVEAAAQKFQGFVREYNREHPELPLSVSLGLAASGGVPAPVADVFKEADNNMYQDKLLRSQSVRSNMVATIMKMLEARDFITEGHAERLQSLVITAAHKLGLSERLINSLRLLAQFHDVGKVGISDRILFKPGRLTAAEFADMKVHCEIGRRIAISSPDLAGIADLILKHHEWWNGKGYPLGLKGEEIPLECRILAIADAYDAMTSDRPYRKALSHRQAVAELKACAGTQFDPVLVDEFIASLAQQAQ